MAPKGSPRMLLAASLLVTDGSLPVKVALSKAGFSAEEIAKEKKQRQARRRRDFLRKKKSITRIKGRRAMTTLPRSLPQRNRETTTISNNSLDANEDVVNSHSTKDASFESESSFDSAQGNDMSRFDALIFACSIQKPISESLSISTTSSLSSLSSSSSSASSSSSSSSLSIDTGAIVANKSVTTTCPTIVDTATGGGAIATTIPTVSSYSSGSVSHAGFTPI